MEQGILYTTGYHDLFIGDGWLDGDLLLIVDRRKGIKSTASIIANACPSFQRFNITT